MMGVMLLLDLFILLFLLCYVVDISWFGVMKMVVFIAFSFTATSLFDVVVTFSVLVLLLFLLLMLLLLLLLFWENLYVFVLLV